MARAEGDRPVKLCQSNTLHELLQMPLNEDVFDRILGLLAQEQKAAGRERPRRPAGCSGGEQTNSSVLR
jgi:hypothetical protein